MLEEKDCCENSFLQYTGIQAQRLLVVGWQAVDHQGLRQMDSVTQAAMLLGDMTVFISMLEKCWKIRHCCCLQCPLCTLSCANTNAELQRHNSRETAEDTVKDVGPQRAELTVYHPPEGIFRSRRAAEENPTELLILQTVQVCVR